MTWISAHQLLFEARRSNQSLACVSVYNLESIQAVVKAAEQAQVPIILSIGNEAIAHAGLTALGRAAVEASRDATVPIIVHLNHCRSLDRVLQGLDLGFGSVMFDGSHLPFKENIQHTRRAAQLAHEAEVTIEGELGPICGPVKGSNDLDMISLAHRFIHETHIDVLALSIPENGVDDLGILQSLVCSLKMPVAIHGASNLGPDGPALVSSMGAIKVNFHSDIKKAFFQGLAASLKDGDISIKTLVMAQDVMTKAVLDKLAIL